MVWCGEDWVLTGVRNDALGISSSKRVGRESDGVVWCGVDWALTGVRNVSIGSGARKSTIDRHPSIQYLVSRAVVLTRR
jgi:hypothetical protein